MKYLLALFLLCLASPSYAQSTSFNPNAMKVIPEGGTKPQPLSELLASSVNVKNFGALGDGVELSDVSATASSAVIDSTAYTFVAADVGKKISVVGAGAAGVAWNCNIVSISSGNAVCDTNASTTVTNAVTTFGTDDLAAFQAAYNNMTATGGNVLIPKGIFVVSGSVDVKDYVTFVGENREKSIIKYINENDMGAAIFQGLDKTEGDPYIGISFVNFTIDATAATQASYDVAGKAVYIQYLKRPSFRDLNIYGTPATSLGADFLMGAYISGNYIEEGGRLNDGTLLGGACIGIATGSETSVIEPLEVNIITENVVNKCGTHGIFVEGFGTASIQNIISNNTVYLHPSKGNGIGDGGSTGTIVSNNSVISSTNTAPLGQGIGIISDNGSFSSPFPSRASMFVNNFIRGTREGIVVDYTVNDPSGTPDVVTISGNKIFATVSYPIRIDSGSTYVVTDAQITNNVFSKANANGVRLEGSAGYANLTISGNKFTDLGTHGIAVLSPVDGGTIHDNQFVGGPTYTMTNALLAFGATAVMTDMSFRSNHLMNVPNGVVLNSGATYAGVIAENTGLNPIGPSTQVVGASPWTYTAGTSPETLYLYGGTVSGVTMGGVTVANSSNTSVKLPANQSAVITYSSIPTASKYIH